MIHGVSSDLPSFKSMTFGPGLNILLADKSEGATDRQSRNGAGKTSFVELVHFLFAGNVERGSIFRADSLHPWLFKAKVDIGKTLIEVARSGVSPSRIYLHGDISTLPLQSVLDVKPVDFFYGREEFVSVERWRALLGAVFFKLGTESDDGEGIRFQPTFRLLFPYFARRQNSGGFLWPTRQSIRQQPWQEQVAISYLLGLDAHIPQEFQEVRAQEKAMVELRRAVKEGGLGQYFGSAADLRTRSTIAEARSRRLREQLATFNVVPEYADLER
jgi:uncharacterized protein YydD (DUF2326 family)